MLCWNYDRKQGEIEHDGHIMDIYDGNCLLIALQRESKLENGNWRYYTPPFFFDDDVHAKRTLGLAKGFDDVFENLDVKITLYRKMWDKSALKKIITLFAQREGNTTIEIREEEENK